MNLFKPGARETVSSARAPEDLIRKSCSKNLRAVHEVSKFCKGPDFTVNVQMTVWDRRADARNLQYRKVFPILENWAASPAAAARGPAARLPAQPEADTGAVSKRRHRVPPAQRRDGAARG